MGQERSNRLVTGHTYVVSRDVCLKNQCNNLFQHGDSGCTMVMMKMVKSRVSGFSRGVLNVRMMSFGICTARYEPVSYCWKVLKAS